MILLIWCCTTHTEEITRREQNLYFLICIYGQFKDFAEMVLKNNSTRYYQLRHDVLDNTRAGCRSMLQTAFSGQYEIGMLKGSEKKRVRGKITVHT